MDNIGKDATFDLAKDRGSKRTKNIESGKFTSSSSNTCLQACEDHGVQVSNSHPMRRSTSKRKGKKETVIERLLQFPKTVKFGWN